MTGSFWSHKVFYLHNVFFRYSFVVSASSFVSALRWNFMHLLFDLRRIDGFLLGLFCYHKLNISSCIEWTRWEKINSDSTDPIFGFVFSWRIYIVGFAQTFYCSSNYIVGGWTREKERDVKCTLSTADKSFLCNLFSVINYNVAECDLSSTTDKQAKSEATVKNQFSQK